MNTLAIVNTVNTVVDLIQKFLPMIHKDDSGTIDKVIDTLQAIAPLAVDQAAVTYTGVKNIIASLGSHPATTEEQLASLKEFSKQIDDAWNEIEKQLDPDA
jgi:hypothetical protein